MTNQSNIIASANVIRRAWEKHGIQQRLRYLGFCLSLLPIPVIQQVGQVIDRYLGNQQLNKALDDLSYAVTHLNSRVNKVETLEEAIIEIAETVQRHEELLEQCKQLSASLTGIDTTFTMETEGASYQEMVNSLVQAGRVFIAARSRSTNVVEHTKIRSPHTHLHASGGSKNYLDDTSFTDTQGTVGTRAISTQGDVHVSGSAVGFGAGGALQFGDKPNIVKGNCPKCSKQVEVDKRQLAGSSKIQCPHCKSVLPFTIG